MIFCNRENFKTYPFFWLLRGGGYNNSTEAGVFNFNPTVNLGGSNGDKSFRLVMCTMM